MRAQDGLPDYFGIRDVARGYAYAEYETGEVGYYELGTDPEELRNVAATLPEAARQRWHDVLRANRECRGTEACWSAQRLATE